MELFSLRLNHILKTYLIGLIPLGSNFCKTHPFMKKLATVKTSGESLLLTIEQFFFSKFEIMQWNDIISKEGFLN